GVVDNLPGRVRPGRDRKAKTGCLGDLPVLAETAVERAAKRRDRVAQAARVDVEERLLLDRIKAACRDGTVGMTDEDAVDVLTDAADPVATGPHQAAVGANATANAPVGQRLGEDRRDGGGGQQRMNGHGASSRVSPTARPRG